MKRDHWVVGEYGIRPVGSPDHCLYCGERRGSIHKSDCVIRRRTVVVLATIEYVIDVPESWDSDAIEFQRNDGSWCANNMLQELEALTEHGCLCERTSFAYLREADAEDEQRDGVSVNESKS